jgi:hypothetical protein
MTNSIPTVKIVSDHPEHGGFVVINLSDFDPKTHKRWVQQTTEQSKEQAKDIRVPRS